MKAKILTTLMLVSCLANISFATVSVERSTDPEYLENTGYSHAIIEMMQQTKANGRGEKYISQDEIKHANDNMFVRGVRKFFMYLDPALDDNKFMNHDIKVTPSVSDL